MYMPVISITNIEKKKIIKIMIQKQTNSSNFILFTRNHPEQTRQHFSKMILVTKNNILFQKAYQKYLINKSYEMELVIVLVPVENEKVHIVTWLFVKSILILEMIFPIVCVDLIKLWGNFAFKENHNVFAVAHKFIDESSRSKIVCMIIVTFTTQQYVCNFTL